jgi:anthranilate synthase component 2
MCILIIDNYDSFTYNLYQAVCEIVNSDGIGRREESRVVVIRNDSISLEKISDLKVSRIIISPGPGSPLDRNYFGICEEVIQELGPTIPLLGVCLGMQGIAASFGAEINKLSQPRHGKTSKIRHVGRGVFAGLKNDISVMRYHSLVVTCDSLPECLEVTAWVGDDPDVIMGVRHKEYPIEGVQFHPESFATELGNSMLKNFITGISFESGLDMVAGLQP